LSVVINEDEADNQEASQARATERPGALLLFRAEQREGLEEHIRGEKDVVLDSHGHTVIGNNLEGSMDGHLEGAD
jgi:hypothetical protein